MPCLPHIIPVTDLRQDTAAVTRRVQASHEPLVLTLEGLIHSKEAAGRPRDLLLLPELRCLQAYRGGSAGSE